jgi:hypothetical protein
MLTIVPPSTIVLLVSIVGIVGMLSVKVMELRSGKRSLLSRMGSGTDHLFTDIYHKITKFLSYFNRKTAIALAQWIAYHILAFLRRTYHKIHALAHLHPHTKKVIDMVHGRAEVGNSTRGAPSAYLKRVSEESKENFIKPIEDRF